MPKLTKLEAGYDTVDSLGRRCGNCAWYESGTCGLVGGQISPIRCCNLWAKTRQRVYPHWLSVAEANRRIADIHDARMQE